MSTDNKNGELAKFCAGDATKSSISKSAPHTAACQSLDATSSMKSADRMSLNNNNALNAFKQERQVKDILVKDIEENRIRLVKLNKENDNKLNYTRMGGISFGPTTRLLPRKQKYNLDKGRITSASGPGHPMLGKSTPQFLLRQVIGCAKREDDKPSPSLVRSSSNEHDMSALPPLPRPRPKPNT